MYHSLKKIAKLILPKSTFLRIKDKLRPLVYLFYKGQKYNCNICQAQLRSFITMHQNDKLCPNCGSLSRHRFLYHTVQNNYTLKGNVLDFSPPAALVKAFSNNKNIQYASSDYVGEFNSVFHFDITAIDSKENAFDTVICFHVLEHIEEDTKAISELHRITKPTGNVFIQTPFKEGNTYEDISIKDPQQRKKHFGQEDHVRIYSLNDLSKKLTNTGFLVNTITSDASLLKFGINPNEIIIVATK